MDRVPRMPNIFIDDVLRDCGLLFTLECFHHVLERRKQENSQHITYS